MGRETICRRKNLTKAGLREFIKPYLLRGLHITDANQVWCTDITYILMASSFIKALYLAMYLKVCYSEVGKLGILLFITFKMKSCSGASVPLRQPINAYCLIVSQ